MHVISRECVNERLDEILFVQRCEKQECEQLDSDNIDNAMAMAEWWRSSSKQLEVLEFGFGAKVRIVLRRKIRAMRLWLALAKMLICLQKPGGVVNGQNVVLCNRVHYTSISGIQMYIGMSRTIPNNIQFVFLYFNDLEMVHKTSVNTTNTKRWLALADNRKEFVKVCPSPCTCIFSQV